MDSQTWDTLEHLIKNQNGPELSALLKDLIDCCEIEQLDKNEVLNQVMTKNNASLLECIAPYYNFENDEYLSFQMALYNRFDNIVDQLAPPPHMWESVIDAFRLDAYYLCLNRWSNLAQDNVLDASILNKIEQDSYSSDAQEAMAAIQERLNTRISHTNLTQALHNISPVVRKASKM